MTSTVDGLEKQGFVVRTPDEDDRRRVQVDITAAGTEIVVETIRRRDELLADMLRELDYTEDELETLRAASELMRRVTDR
jgi:DNA-binding MarR family transcriptional regulator